MAKFHAYTRIFFYEYEQEYLILTAFSNLLSENMRQSEKGEIENQNGREIQRDNGMMMNGKLQGQLYPSQKEIKRKRDNGYPFVQER